MLETSRSELPLLAWLQCDKCYRGAPRWRPLSWVANPGNPAMSPHAKGKESRHSSHSLIKQWKEVGGKRGGEKEGAAYEKTTTNNKKKTKNKNNHKLKYQ